MLQHSLTPLVALSSAGVVVLGHDIAGAGVVVVNVLLDGEGVGSCKMAGKGGGAERYAHKKLSSVA